LGLLAIVVAMTAARFFLAMVLKRDNSGWMLLGSIAIAAAGAGLLVSAPGYLPSLVSALLIGAGLAAGFPVVLSFIGDRFPQQSGTAFSSIFTFALIGNMAINKSFGYIAQSHGIRHYATTMLVLLAMSAMLLSLMISRLRPNTLK
jgi:MFS family permease